MSTGVSTGISSGMSTERQRVDVVVCVHNSPEHVAPCLASVQETLGPGDRLILVDDGSAAETQALCEAALAAAPDRVLLIRREAGSGYCKAANAGMRASTAETVVLLNSDTIVLPHWIDRIDRCMAANWQIGIVGPLSNSGGWQTIPELPDPSNPAPLVREERAVIEAVHAHCESYAARFEYPLVEQINGFCMALRRAVLDEVGLFDEAAFPMGYGEESDLTLRALDAGYLAAVAIDCFVHHVKTRSYSTEQRARYNAAGQEALRARHGAYRVEMAVKSTQRNTILAAIRKDARETFPDKGWLTSEAAE